MSILYELTFADKTRLLFYNSDIWRVLALFCLSTENPSLLSLCLLTLNSLLSDDVIRSILPCEVDFRESLSNVFFSRIQSKILSLISAKVGSSNEVALLISDFLRFSHKIVQFFPNCFDFSKVAFPHLLTEDVGSPGKIFRVCPSTLEFRQFGPSEFSESSLWIARLARFRVSKNSSAFDPPRANSRVSAFHELFARSKVSTNFSYLKNKSINILGNILYWEHEVCVEFFGNASNYQRQLLRLFYVNLELRDFEVFGLLAWIFLNLCKKPLHNQFILENSDLLGRFFESFLDFPPQQVSPFELTEVVC